MIIVHETFVCKPGNTSKLIKLFKETMAENKELVHVMTDMTGQYNRVITVSQYESLDNFAKMFEEYKPSNEQKESREKMRKFTDLFLSGSREIYKVW